jgi:hypothetical protein
VAERKRGRVGSANDSEPRKKEPTLPSPKTGREKECRDGITR